MTTTELVLALAKATGVSGLETGAAAVARPILEALGECVQTPLGSLLCRVKTAAPDRPHVMLTAHMDSIGMIVTGIDDKGFLRVSNCGGLDRSLLLAAQVTVHTKNGDLPGVICSIPPHLNPDDSKLPKIEEISIDVGLTESAARERIALGDRITFVSESAQMPGGRICAGVLDDRSGCAAVLLAAQKAAAMELDCSLTVALTVMEEIGGQGAKTAAFSIAPTHAIVVDVSFGHTPGLPRYKCGELDKGPMIGISPILDNEMTEQLQKTAKLHDIPYQLEVMGGSTGTDTDQVATAHTGVRCAMLSIPLRYMHTPVEIISAGDVEAVANLTAAYLGDVFGGAR